ncbi:MAG: hypothetical protein DMF60_06345 [Acidobacteria bacterium]|nr:MAG: hypothetical protein DMF60_06345 [Acidobacteriota bacterium]
MATRSCCAGSGAPRSHETRHKLFGLSSFVGSALAAQPVVNIRSFGAVPDDGVDHGAAIQAAFDSLDPDEGGTVLCPPGAYEVSTPIVVKTSAVRFAAWREPTE